MIAINECMIAINECMNKKVSFSNIYYIHIIPKNDNMYNDVLWWNDVDRLNAVNDTLADIKRLLDIHPDMDVHQVKKLLFQPNNIIYDGNNFTAKIV